jgi:hypothetical protein
MKTLLFTFTLFLCSFQVCIGQIPDEIVIPSQEGLPVIGKGNWIVPPIYQRMAYLDYEPELFPVANSSGKWGYINKKGEVVIPFQYQLAYGFSEGLAAVLNENSLYGYINIIGDLKIPYQYSYAGRFRNGHAVVLKNGKNHLINSNGEKTTEEYIDMEWLSDKYIACKQGGLYGIKDLSGKQIKAPFFSDYFPYTEGLAGVKVQGKWGFMDENFNLVIKPKYMQKVDYSFSEGFARFKQNNKVGLMDKSGNMVLLAQYEDLGEFSNGLIAFQQNEKWGYINVKAEVIIEPQYYEAYNFMLAMAVVKDYNMKTNLIDAQNNYIISSVQDINKFSKNLLGVYINGGWGLFLLDK